MFTNKEYSKFIAGMKKDMSIKGLLLYYLYCSFSIHQNISLEGGEVFIYFIRTKFFNDQNMNI